MNKKVTIQDIADALGISRNTVSKAINNSEGLADSTREKILQKAIEMGYKQFSYAGSLAAISGAPAASESERPQVGTSTGARLSGRNRLAHRFFPDAFSFRVPDAGQIPAGNFSVGLHHEHPSGHRNRACQQNPSDHHEHGAGQSDHVH